MISAKIAQLKTRIAGMKQKRSIVKKIQIFKFQPFSLKQKKVLTWWMPNSPVKDHDGIIADGAIRSGKTVSMSLSFVFWAMSTFNGQNFGMCGKTIGSFRRNVLFWLKIMLRSRGYSVADHRADNLILVSRGRVTNYFYIFGGKDERSQDLIQGITIAGIFFDEVALMPESFVNQATGRCSVDGSQYWFNCNPDGSYHWFKLNWIDKVKEKRLLYLHFTMDDNLSLSENIKNRYKSMYSGVFFKRFILGLWVAAQGLIYDMITEDNIYDDTTRPYQLELIAQRGIAVDYGTTNPCVFLDVYDDGTTIWIDDEYRWDSKSEEAMRHPTAQKTDAQYADAMETFMKKGQDCEIIIDPSATSFKVELQNRMFFVTDADNDVLNGIRATSTLFGKRFIKIHKVRCPGLMKELNSYVWNEKKTLLGEEEPLKQNDHGPDALRYYVNTKVPKWRTGIQTR